MRSFSLFLCFSLLLTACFAQNDGLSDIVKKESHFQSQVARITSHILTQDYNVHYHRLLWKVDPTKTYITGEVSTWFAPDSSGFQALHFDCASNLKINEVLWHGQKAVWSQAVKDILRIDLPVAVAAGQIDSVTIRYEGVPMGTGFGSFARSTHGNNNPILLSILFFYFYL